MLFRIKSYISFIRNASASIGTGSLFVSELVTQCFSAKTPTQQIRTYQNFRKRLSENTTTIHVSDFGAGSKVFKSNERVVSKIAKHAGISSRRAELLIRITAYFKPQHILEIGTSLGLGTAALYLGNPNANIVTLEGCPETAAIAQQQFEQFNFKTINTLVGNFKDTLPKALTQTTYDLVYFDGNHQKEATLNYFEMCLSTAHNDTIFIFDDIHWSKEMAAAWDSITAHPRVTTTIDTFQWGFVFFTKELPKQKLTLRV